MSSELESGLIIPIPEAEPTVGRWRRALDLSAGLGVPAHVTVLYPFLHPDRIDDGVLEELGSIFAGTAAFDVELREVAWFGQDVVYAAPRPEEPFRDLTAELFDRWPECPPYGGAHGDPTPHLTIGDQGTFDQRSEAAREVTAELPVVGRAAQVWLMAGSGEVRWERIAAFDLAGDDRDV